MIHCRSLKVLKAEQCVAGQLCHGRDWQAFGACLNDWVVDTGNGVEFVVYTNAAFTACFEAVDLDDIYMPCPTSKMLGLKTQTWREWRQTAIGGVSVTSNPWNG